MCLKKTTDRRLREAKEMLKNGRMFVNEIIRYLKKKKII